MKKEVWVVKSILRGNVSFRREALWCHCCVLSEGGTVVSVERGRRGSGV